MTSDHARMEEMGKWRKVGGNVKGLDHTHMNEEGAK